MDHVQLDEDTIRQAFASAAQYQIDVRDAVREIVLDGEIKAFDKKRQIYRLVKDALLKDGRLCRTQDGRVFYFSNCQRRLHDLEQEAFSHLLTHASGLSPTESYFGFVASMLRADAAETRPVEVHAMAHFDPGTITLSVSDGASGVWRYSDGQWSFTHNGDGLLFLTEPEATSWEPDFSAKDHELKWFFGQIPFAPNGILSIDDQCTAYLVALMQRFFPPYLRTSIIPAFLGPQGSGKTTTMKLTGRLMLGPQFEVIGLRADKEDSFIAALTNRTICAFDNADSRIKWLEDSLATYATGQRYQLRKLYTTNDLVSYMPRAFVMISSRDPQFRRPDVSERLLPFRFVKLQAYQDEDTIFTELEKRREAIIGALLKHLAALVASLVSTRPPPMPFRMADYAAFGYRLFKPRGQESNWLSLLKRLEASQARFAGEDDGLVETLRVLFHRHSGKIGPIATAELFKQCGDIAAENGFFLPRTSIGFGKKISNMKRVIELELNAKLTEDYEHEGKRIITIGVRS